MKMLQMLGAATLAVGLSASAQADTIGLAIMPQGTLGYSTGSSIASDLNEKMDVGAVSQPNSGETALIPLVNSGELDFGIVNIFYRPRLAPNSHAFACIRRASRDHQCSAFSVLPTTGQTITLACSVAILVWSAIPDRTTASTKSTNT